MNPRGKDCEYRKFLGQYKAGHRVFVCTYGKKPYRVCGARTICWSYDRGCALNFKRKRR
jgi:hypothetical protein